MNVCMYCDKLGPVRVSSGSAGLNEDLCVCDMHWGILKNPVTALPFLKGITMMEIQRRGTPMSYAEEISLKKYFRMLESFKKPSPKN